MAEQKKIIVSLVNVFEVPLGWYDMIFLYFSVIFLTKKLPLLFFSL